LKERAAKAGKALLRMPSRLSTSKLPNWKAQPKAIFSACPPGAKQPENFSSLNQHFGGILSVADSADAAPTTQATAVFKELEEALGKLIARWSKIRHRISPR